MDIVISTHPGRHQDLKMKYCLRGLGNIAYDNMILFVDFDHPTSDYSRILNVANRDSVSEKFIWMPDNCFLLAPFVPARYINMGMLQRRPSEMEMMTNTIRFLMNRDQEAVLYDYELDMPMVFEKSKVLQMASEMERTDILPRSMYGNMFPEPFLRIDNPLIEQWSHYDDPKQAIIALSDTALEHPQCQRWLKRKLPEPSALEPCTTAK